MKNLWKNKPSDVNGMQVYRYAGSDSHTVWDSVWRQVVVGEFLPFIANFDGFGKLIQLSLESLHGFLYRFLNEVFIRIRA